MRVKIIGGHGGVTKNYSATSYLIDDKLLIDAGSVAQGLDIQGQININNILLSHAHLDHTKDLAFISDNCFGLKDSPFQVYCHESVHRVVKEHLFNDKIWPDFSVLPSAENPTIKFNEIKSEEVIELDGYTITPIHVNHPVEMPKQGLGFIIEKNEVALVFTQDTAATDKIWELSQGKKNIKAIFTEVSFPNKLQSVADLSDHHTPRTMKEELKKMPKDIPVYLGHLKPNYQQELIEEVNLLEEPRLIVMSEDNLEFEF